MHLYLSARFPEFNESNSFCLIFHEKYIYIRNSSSLRSDEKGMKLHLTKLTSTIYLKSSKFYLFLVLGNLPCLLGGAGGLADIYDSPVARKGAGLPELARGPQTFPEFVPLHSGNVTTALGKTAMLNCRVRNVNNKTVIIIYYFFLA